MDITTHERLLGYRHAFDQAATCWIVATVAGLLFISPLVIFALQFARVIQPPQSRELWRRYGSWCLLVPLMVAPILLGALWTMIAVGVLGLLAFREFSAAIGLASDVKIVRTVYAGIIALTFAAVDHWYGLFAALLPLVTGAIAAVAILDDRPQGYIRRVALGVWGFMVCGSALAHLGFLANDRDYRPIMLLILLAVEMNDVFAYCSGKALGRRKLAVATSPNKTLGGALGALILTTALVVVLGYGVFAGSTLQETHHLIVLGILISLLGQLGDLMVSSVKRDIGIKDTGSLLPGHGGLLDRFDSLLLVAPAVFHYIHYFRGIGMDQPSRMFSQW